MVVIDVTHWQQEEHFFVGSVNSGRLEMQFWSVEKLNKPEELEWVQHAINSAVAMNNLRESRELCIGFMSHVWFQALDALHSVTHGLLGFQC